MKYHGGLGHIKNSALKNNVLKNSVFGKARKGELGFSQIASLAIVLLVIIAIAVAIIPQISKKGKTIENITILTTGDLDGDGVPNGLDRCCPAQCKADRSELETLAPSDKRYGCAPWQQSVACEDTLTNCGTAA